MVGRCLDLDNLNYNNSTVDPQQQGGDHDVPLAMVEIRVWLIGLSYREFLIYELSSTSRSVIIALRWTWKNFIIQISPGILRTVWVKFPSALPIAKAVFGI